MTKAARVLNFAVERRKKINAALAELVAGISWTRFSRIPFKAGERSLEELDRTSAAMNRDRPDKRATEFLRASSLT